MIKFFLAMLIALSAGACKNKVHKTVNEATAEGQLPPAVESIPEQDDHTDSSGRAYRTIVLDNKLTVLMMHDPAAHRAAAALSVAVGTLQDPDEHQGLAHFLEHMLSMGTSKYPAAGAYERYVASYQGYNNAYTSAEETSYYFELNPEGFRGALARFAQLFSAPLLPQGYIARELNAVHNEHQKNLQSDRWRTFRILNLLSKEGHARRKFAVGNKETLKNVNREVLVDFYRRYYSANRMKLALLTPLSLDEQEEQVRALFVDLPNNNRAALTYDTDIYDDSLLPQKITLEPVADIQQVVLTFALPSLHHYWQSKPDHLLSALVGDEGKGSLLALLKRRGYATALDTAMCNSSYAGEFNVTIDLTAQGLAELDRVVALFFAYVKMLKRSGLQEYFYDERARLAQIDYDYRPPLAGADAVIYYASSMHRHMPLVAARRDSLYLKYAPLDFRILLNHITARKVRLIVIAKGIKTDRVEPHYGINYSVANIPATVYRQWVNPPTHAELHYPVPNAFIPASLAVLADNPSDQPYKLLSTEQGVFWFQQDTQLLRPKASLHLKLLSTKTSGTPQQVLLSLLYVHSLRESISTWLYPITMAGLDLSITRHDRGLSIDISGYSDKLPRLLAALAPRLRQITIDATAFGALKRKLKRELASRVYAHGYLQALEMAEVILTRDAIPPTAYEGMIDTVTLAQVRVYGEEFFRQIAYEGVAYGNLAREVLGAKLKAFIKQLHAETLPAAERKTEQIVRLNQRYTYALKTESNNHALLRVVQMGGRTPAREAQLRIIAAHIGTAFHTELRSEQQLGYVVRAGLYNFQRVLGLHFIVQSATHTPQQIAESIDDFLPRMTNQLRDLNEIQLDAYRQGIITKLHQPELSIADQHRRLRAQAFVHDGDFAYRHKLSDALSKVTRDDIIAAWHALISNGQLNIALHAKGTELASLPHTTTIADIEQFKQSRPVYR